MTDHLPECCMNMTDAPERDGHCICDRLRACEQRVAAETISRLDRWQQHSPLGRKSYEDGVQAARDAVDAVSEWGGPELSRILAAIDALKGEA